MASRDSVLVSRSIYQMGIVTLAVSVVWVILSVYTALRDPQTVEVDKSLLEPLSTSIDQEVIEMLTARLRVEENLPIPVVEEVEEVEEIVEVPEVIEEFEEIVEDDTIELDEDDEFIN